MWDALRPQLEGLDPVRVENPAHPGTPDVNYMEGWIELKFASAWPVHEATPLRLPHFTPQQRIWLRRRWMIGGRVFLLLKVKQEWLLFDGRTAARVVGEANRAALIDAALFHWHGLPPKQEFQKCITRTRPVAPSAYSSLVAEANGPSVK